jgi:hypothetical protein
MPVNSIPPFVKGGEGGFLKASKANSPCPPFSKGDLKAKTYLRISYKLIYIPEGYTD